MKLKYVIAIAIALVAVGLLWYEYEEERMGTSLEVGDNLTISGVSLTFLGETQVDCGDFPPQAQKECKESEFFTFRVINASVYQGHFMAWVALPGTKRYDKNDTGSSLVVISSYDSSIVDSPRGFYELRYVSTHPTHVEWVIETKFKS